MDGILVILHSLQLGWKADQHVHTSEWWLILSFSRGSCPEVPNQNQNLHILSRPHAEWKTTSSHSCTQYIRVTEDMLVGSSLYIFTPCKIYWEDVTSQRLRDSDNSHSMIFHLTTTSYATSQQFFLILLRINSESECMHAYCVIYNQ